MAISGSLSDFSLPEIFQLLEQGNKTGRLTIQEQSQPSSQKAAMFHIWFKQGHIVAASDKLDGQGLMTLIQQRGWITARVASRVAEVCAVNQPAGLCLKSQGLLEAEQLKLLFSQQVLQQVCKLFEVADGKFGFDNKAPLPSSEMTGLAAPPREVTLAGLRVLRNWMMLQEKLPEANSGLISTVMGNPPLRLNQLESQVWEFANGSAQIQDIAYQLQLPIEKIRQVAFRLMVVGLAEEVPWITEAPLQQIDLAMDVLTIGEKVSPVQINSGPDPLQANSIPAQLVQSNVSPSFLQNLVGFLKGKT